MTVYEMNYTKRLDEMVDAIIHKYGFENEKVVLFITWVEKLYNQANYQNREKLEKMFKGFMK